jgi:small subunit ribosomal protein S2
VLDGLAAGAVASGVDLGASAEPVEPALAAAAPAEAEAVAEPEAAAEA